MIEVEIKIVVARGFGEYHKESIFEDLKATKELEGLKSCITVETVHPHSTIDIVRVRICGENVSEKALNRFVEWTCQYHEGTVSHSKNYQGGNQHGD